MWGVYRGVELTRGQRAEHYPLPLSELDWCACRHAAAGETEPTEGTVWKHPNLRIAYVAQVSSAWAQPSTQPWCHALWQCYTSVPLFHPCPVLMPLCSTDGPPPTSCQMIQTPTIPSPPLPCPLPHLFPPAARLPPRGAAPGRHPL